MKTPKENYENGSKDILNATVEEENSENGSNEIINAAVKKEILKRFQGDHQCHIPVKVRDNLNFYQDAWLVENLKTSFQTNNKEWRFAIVNGEMVLCQARTIF